MIENTLEVRACSFCSFSQHLQEQTSAVSYFKRFKLSVGFCYSSFFIC